mgnify:CR=1 FL=1
MMKPEDSLESSCRVEIIQITDTMRQEKLEEILHKGADKSAVAGNKCKRNERLCV